MDLGRTITIIMTLLQVKNEVDHGVSLSDSYCIHRLLCIFPMRNVSLLIFHNDYVIESDYGRGDSMILWMSWAADPWRSGTTWF